jgi:hypothetical protein
MRLMGHWNWWLPKWLEGPLSKVSLAEVELGDSVRPENPPVTERAQRPAVEGNS